MEFINKLIDVLEDQILAGFGYATTTDNVVCDSEDWEWHLENYDPAYDFTGHGEGTSEDWDDSIPF